MMLLKGERSHPREIGSRKAGPGTEARPRWPRWLREQWRKLEVLLLQALSAWPM
jgi:hypothetical protein